jgi:hypothetical protein
MLINQLNSHALFSCISRHSGKFEVGIQKIGREEGIRTVAPNQSGLTKKKKIMTVKFFIYFEKKTWK